MKNVRIWIAALLTLLINVLCIPLWTECDYGGFILTLFGNETNLDLVYEGNLTGAEPFRFKSQSEFCKDFLMHYDRNDRRRAKLVLRPRKEWQKFSLHLEALQDGKITVRLRGPYIPNEYGQPYSCLTDWANFKINGKVVFSDCKTIATLKSFASKIPVKKNERLLIEVEFRRHPFSIHDFAFLQSGKLWYFVTGNLLFFFLIYRLLSWFSIQGGGITISDSLLLIMFFFFLFIPVMSISDGVMSIREGRKLAVKPELEGMFDRNSIFGRRYESWLNDHFGGRVPLIKLHDAIRNKLNKIVRTKRAIYFKDRGWMFNTPLVSDFNWSSISIRSAVYGLSQLNKFCLQNNIKFYVFETPKKESVYKEIIMGEYGLDRRRLTKVSQAQEAIRTEARKRNIPWIYPYKELCDATKKDLVFFKWSWHWTDWGAFVGYQEFMKEVCKKFPDIPVVSLDDYGKSQSWLIRDTWHREYVPGYFYQFFNMSHAPHNRTYYNYYDHKDCDKVMLKVERYIKDFTYLAGKHKIMLMSTSQTDNFLQFLPFSAAQTKQIRLNRKPIEEKEQFKILNLYRKDILDFKPDILVLSISTDNLTQLCDLFSTK